MSAHLHAIPAIVRKDLRSLMPLVLLSFVVFLAHPLIASLDLEAMAGDTQLWRFAQSSMYWLSYFMGILLMVSVLQQDPARSLTHDSLTRPLGRTDLLLAKLLFMFLCIAVPVMLGRLLINLRLNLDVATAVANAVSIEKLPAVLPVPLLFAAALMTPNLRALIALLVKVLLVFLIPGWSVTRPLLGLLGIEIGTEFNGLGWVQAAPIFLAGLLACALVYYALYWRRQMRASGWLFAACVALVFFSVYPPGWLYDWDRAIAANRLLLNTADATLEDEVFMSPVQACFPAALHMQGITQSGADHVLVNAAWPEAVLAAAGPQAVTFATTLRTPERLREWIQPTFMARSMSVKWRVDRVRARAWYSSDSLQAPLELTRSSTAINRFAAINNVDTDYWLLPVQAARTLAADPSTRLHFEYDLALMSPNAHELSTDGVLRRVPGLGSCRAQHDRSRNLVQVECFKTGEQPALVSAELIGIEGSRVDSAVQAAFTPGWIEALGSRHYELNIASPSLVKHDSILVTAWTLERLFNKQLTSTGLLGEDASLCPLPDSADSSAQVASNWQDRSPHQVLSVAVEPGVRLEVLDWRNGASANAPTLLLLHGLGATAHSFDQLAARLSERYPVLAITRRGVGESDKPDRGYDIARLSQDVLQVMESLGLEKPLLLGHSIAGEELSYLGAHFPERFSGLIYLDAAYDRVTPSADSDDREFQMLNARLPLEPPLLPSETLSYQALRQARRSGERGLLPPEGEIMASYDLDTGALRHDMRYLDAIMMGLQAPDYKRIGARALALYAMPGSAEALMKPWYDREDQALREIVARLFAMERSRKQAQMAEFASGVADGQVLAIEDADHWIFVSNEDEVVKAIDDFAMGNI